VLRESNCFNLTPESASENSPFRQISQRKEQSPTEITPNLTNKSKFSKNESENQNISSIKKRLIYDEFDRKEVSKIYIDEQEASMLHPSV